MCQQIFIYQWNIQILLNINSKNNLNNIVVINDMEGQVFN